MLRVPLWAAFGAGLAAAGLIVCHMVGCAPDAATPERTLADHQAKCESKGAFIAATRPCTEAELELEVLVRKDPDCRAYFGDASVSLRCGPEAGQ